MYKTAVYTLVNGGITHENSEYKNVILRSMTLNVMTLSVNVLLSNFTFLYLRFLMCNAAVN